MCGRERFGLSGEWRQAPAQAWSPGHQNRFASGFHPDAGPAWARALSAIAGLRAFSCRHRTTGGSLEILRTVLTGFLAKPELNSSDGARSTNRELRIWEIGRAH